MFFFFFKQKTAYEVRISDWSSDVCSSDLPHPADLATHGGNGAVARNLHLAVVGGHADRAVGALHGIAVAGDQLAVRVDLETALAGVARTFRRSEERRVGQAWVSTCRTRGSPHPQKKKTKNKRKTQH